MKRNDVIGITTGLLFIATGSFKLLAPPLGPGLEGGARGFAHVLELLGVPLPQVFGWLVPGVEVAGGLALLSRRARRAAALCLAIDMMVAIVLVGLPGARGRPLRIGNYSLGSEPWRLSLEIALLAATLFLVVKAPPKPDEQPSSD